MSESPVVLSQYDPSGQFLAYVTVALDKHRVSVELTNAGKANGLVNENFLYLEDSQSRVTCLQWVHLASSDAQLVALGLNSGEVWLYAPSANQVVYKLSTGALHAIRDFQCKGQTAWCCDQSDTVYQFNMTEFTVAAKFKVEGCENLQKLCVVDEQHILLASHSISLVDVQSKLVVQTFPGHISAVSNLIMLNSSAFLTSATNDRFLNIYDLATGGTKSVLVAQSDVLQLSHYNDSTVAVTTEDGTIEVFPDPLVNTSKKRRRTVSKQSTHLIKIQRPESEERVAAVNVFITADTLNYAWLENATIPYFDQLQWAELPATHLITKSRPSATSKHANRTLHGEDVAAAKSYVEGNATVTSGDNFKHVHEAIAELERGGADASDSLADRMASSSLGDDHAGSKRSKKRVTTGTLTVVLSQSLQSNDHSLLETVLNNRDEKIIKGTISRLQPSLAVLLLERLAERIARQTNRQGPLNVWVKWCLIIHGGYLARMPNLMSSLASLHSTLRKRSEILPRLQALETRLDFSLNQLDAYRASHVNLGEMSASAFGVGEDNEEEVEYCEELDDAGLIEDGELDDDEDFSDSEDDQSDNDQRNGNFAEEDGIDGEGASEGELDDEHGYSDVEGDDDSHPNGHKRV